MWSLCGDFNKVAVNITCAASEEDLQGPTTIAVSQIRFLQEQHSMLMVNSTFGGGVERLYKRFKRRDIDVDALQVSVVLHNQIEDNRTQRGRGRASGCYCCSAGRVFNSRGRGYGPCSGFNN